MRTRSYPTLRMLTLLLLMAVAIRVPLQARADRSPGAEGEAPVRYLVYVAAPGDVHEAPAIQALWPRSEGMGNRARVVLAIRLGRHQVQLGDDLGEPETAGLAGPNLRLGVEEWLRRQPAIAPTAAPGNPRFRIRGLVLRADGAGRVLGEAAGSLLAAPGVSPPISTDINFSTWGKVKELFR